MKNDIIKKLIIENIKNISDNYKTEYVIKSNILLIDSSDFFYVIYFYENCYEAYQLNLLTNKYKLSADYEFDEYFRVFSRSLIRENLIKLVCKLKLRSSTSD